MQIEIKIDENCRESKIIVVTDKMTSEINEIIKRISGEQPKIIVGFKDGVAKVLEPSDVYRFFCIVGKCICRNESWGVYSPYEVV